MIETVAEVEGALGTPLVITTDGETFTVRNDGRVTQENLTPVEIVRYLANTVHSLASMLGPVTLFHVEYNCGMITGNTFSELGTARVFAQMQANLTRKPTTLSRMVIPFLSRERLVLIIEDNDHAFEWPEEGRETFEPEAAE